MRKSLFLLILLFLLVSLGAIVSAQDDENLCLNGTWMCANPDDPAREEWNYTCGWYWAHHYLGTFTVEEVPLWCGRGCDPNDSDCDGVLDADDDCPNDSDCDGVLDADDDCPTKPQGAYGDYGCPGPEPGCYEYHLGWQYFPGGTHILTTWTTYPTLADCQNGTNGSPTPDPLGLIITSSQERAEQICQDNSINPADSATIIFPALTPNAWICFS